MGPDFIVYATLIIKYFLTPWRPLSHTKGKLFLSLNFSLKVNMLYYYKGMKMLSFGYVNAPRMPEMRRSSHWRHLSPTTQGTRLPRLVHWSWNGLSLWDTARIKFHNNQNEDTNHAYKALSYIKSSLQYPGIKMFCPKITSGKSYNSPSHPWQQIHQTISTRWSGDIYKQIKQK